MTISALDHRLHVGGTLDPRKHIYIERPEDERLLNLLLSREYCSVLTSRQMGKSSLMVRTAYRLHELGALYVQLDFSGGFGSPQAPEQWYLGIIAEIAASLHLHLDVATWWTAATNMTINQRLLQFFRERVAPSDSKPVVIFIDEIDATLHLPYTDDLFTAIRTMYNQRPFVEAYQKITFCLLGVAAPNELIKSRRKTPFNIGKIISLGDFAKERDDLSPLSRALDPDPDVGELLLSRVVHWTDGHPYLTVRLCEEINQKGLRSDLDVDLHVASSYADLDHLATDQHFRTILNHLSARVANPVRALRLYKRVLDGAHERDSSHLEYVQLKLVGLIKAGPDGHLRIRNRLYAKLFDSDWLSAFSARGRLYARLLDLKWLMGVAQAPVRRSHLFGLLLSLVLLAVAFIPLTLSRPYHATVVEYRGVEPDRGEVLSRYSLQPDLKPMTPRECTFHPGETHVYLFSLDAGEFVNLEVEQRGIDVSGLVLGPRGTKVLQVDSPTGGSGVERLSFVAAVRGEYRLLLTSLKSTSADGNYRITVTERRHATRIDRTLADAVEALSIARLLHSANSASASEEAIPKFEAALERFQLLGDLTGQEAALGELAGIYRASGRTDRAIALYERALPLTKQKAMTLALIASALSERNDLLGAITYYQRSLLIWEQTADDGQRAEVARAIGQLYRLLGRPDESLEFCSLAIEHAKKSQNKGELARSMEERAEAYSTLQDYDKAAIDVRLAASLFRQLGDASSEALALSRLAVIYARVGSFELVEPLAERALTLNDLTALRSPKLAVLVNLGTAREIIGRLSSALKCYQEALELSRRLKDRRQEARMLGLIASIHLRLADTGPARVEYTQALSIWRQVHNNEGEASSLLGLAKVEFADSNPESSKEYILAALQLVESSRGILNRRPYYSFYIDLLMALDRKYPLAGHGAKAFEVADYMHASGLSSSRSASVAVGPEPQLLAKIRASLLDRGTVLLEYSVGDERSYLWVVTSDEIRSFELPRRQLLERIITPVFTAMSRPQLSDNRINLDQRLSQVADVVLEPAVRSILASRRVLVVTEGILDRVPFAALPLQQIKPTGNVALINTHEILTLPSASYVVRRREQSRVLPERSGEIAIFSSTPLKQSRQELLASSYADIEARTIAALSKGRTFLAMGPLASRETAISGRLGNYRFLHFSAPVSLDAEGSELIGLELSRTDEDGRPQDPLLSVADIQRLYLPADLVVLSSCQVGLGRATDMRGPKNLAAAFLQAGAGGVLISLWNVDNEARTEFVKLFYLGVLKDELPPVEALRRAQLVMLRTSQWRSQSYWAGFVLVGDS